MALQTCAVSVQVLAPDGSPVTSAIVMAELSERVMQDGVIVPERIVKKTNAEGRATLDLWPNGAQPALKTWYRVIINTPQGKVEVFNISVPNAQAANMRSIELAEVPEGGAEALARMLASLANIEAETKGDATKAEQALQQVTQKIANFDARVMQPDYWEGTIADKITMYPLAGATIEEPKLYDVVIDGIPQRPTIDYKIHIDKSDASNSKIELIGSLPAARNWWALTRTIFNTNQP